ncbi:MAG: hypothetical protein HS132_16960 [Planctomycetia bacterium]|nr:hypothetical protein [Planctomycetia bacterium]
MLIDWFTVLSQVINFLILVFLLKYFLYGRIISAMNAREQKIASRLHEADNKRAEAEEERELYRKKNTEFNNKREEMLTQAREEAEVNGKELIEKAREEVNAVKKRWHEALQEEKESFLQELRKKAGRQVCAITSRVFSDLSDSHIEQCMINVFLRKLKNINNAELSKMKESMRTSEKAVSVSSAFEISEDAQQEINHEIHTYLMDDRKIVYGTSPDLVCGIELKVGDYVIGWNLNDYVTALEEEVNKTIEEELSG